MSKPNKKYRAKPAAGEKTVDGKKMSRTTAKSTAIRLAASLAVLLSVYFGFIKAGFQIIQEIYIWSAFVIALCYIFCAFFIAYIKNGGKYKNSKKAAASLPRLESLGKLLLILLIPMLFALLSDYMLIMLGLAESFGI